MIYTAKKIADILGKPPTTVRTWGEKYKDYIPLGDKVSGRRQYNDEGLTVFRKIEELQNKGLIKSEVIEELKKDFPLHLDGDEQGVQTSGLVQYQQYNDLLNYFRTKFEKDDELIKLQREEIVVLKEQTALLKRALESDKLDTLKKEGITRSIKKTDKTDTLKKGVSTRRKKGISRSNKKVSIRSPKKKVVKQKPFGKTKNKGWLDMILGR